MNREEAEEHIDNAYTAGEEAAKDMLAIATTNFNETDIPKNFIPIFLTAAGVSFLSKVISASIVTSNADESPDEHINKVIDMLKDGVSHNLTQMEAEISLPEEELSDLEAIAQGLGLPAGKVTEMVTSFLKDGGKAR